MRIDDCTAKSKLDDVRVLFAVERASLSWLRTAFALMGFGFLIDRSGARFAHREQPAAVAVATGSQLRFGIALRIIGAGVAAVSVLQFRTVLRGLGEKEVPREYWTNLGVWLNFVLAGVALALAPRFVSSG